VVEEAGHGAAVILEGRPGLRSEVGSSEEDETSWTATSPGQGQSSGGAEEGLGPRPADGDEGRDDGEQAVVAAEPSSLAGEVGVATGFWGRRARAIQPPTAGPALREARAAAANAAAEAAPEARAHDTEVGAGILPRGNGGAPRAAARSGDQAPTYLAEGRREGVEGRPDPVAKLGEDAGGGRSGRRREQLGHGRGSRELREGRFFVYLFLSCQDFDIIDTPILIWQYLIYTKGMYSVSTTVQG
jgi:hypothetical protein